MNFFQSCWRAIVTALVFDITGFTVFAVADTPRLPATGPIRVEEPLVVEPGGRVFSSSPLVRLPTIQEIAINEDPLREVPSEAQAEQSADQSAESPSENPAPTLNSATVIQNGGSPYSAQPVPTDVYDLLLHEPVEYVYYTTEEYHHRWLQLESVFYWTQGVELPAVVSTSAVGTAAVNAGVLGQPSTTPVVGPQEIFDWVQAGFRIRGGQWSQDDDGTGWVADLTFVGNREFNFNQTSNGTPIIARPFNNLLNGGQPDAQLVAFPGISQGSLSINAETRWYSLGVAYWTEFFVDRCRKCDECGTYHWDTNEDRVWGLKIGPRFTHLDDTFNATESLTSATTGTNFLLVDSFKSETSFLGGEIGVRVRQNWGALSLDAGVNLALGANRQEVDIAGSSVVTPVGAAPIPSNSGFFAQPTNIGNFDRTRFSLQPSLELALGYETDNDWKFTVAYNLLYWTDVVRATEHIDPNLNPDFFPPSIGTSNSPGPQFRFNESDFLAHGISIGIEKRW